MRPKLTRNAPHQTVAQPARRARIHNRATRRICIDTHQSRRIFQISGRIDTVKQIGVPRGTAQRQRQRLVAAIHTGYRFNSHIACDARAQLLRKICPNRRVTHRSTSLANQNTHAHAAPLSKAIASPKENTHAR
jgi:thiamine phosphate synthase YjbQ (UPF0047 family)